MQTHVPDKARMNQLIVLISTEGSFFISMVFLAVKAPRLNFSESVLSLVLYKVCN